MASLDLPVIKKYPGTPACQGMSAEIFYQEALRAEAKKVCLTCPLAVRRVCLEEFRMDRWAVAGGYTPQERAYLRKRKQL